MEDPKYNKKPSKRALRQRAARDAANAQIKSKLAQLRTTLETERVKFEEFKVSISFKHSFETMNKLINHLRARMFNKISF